MAHQSPQRRPSTNVESSTETPSAIQRLMAECAASVEQNPKTETYMREHALPLWHHINHEKESAAR